MGISVMFLKIPAPMASSTLSFGISSNSITCNVVKSHDHNDANCLGTL
jgi:hypothetical protein